MGSVVSSKKKFKLEGPDSKPGSKTKQKIKRLACITGAEEERIGNSIETRNQSHLDMDGTGNITSVSAETTKEEEGKVCNSFSDPNTAAVEHGMMEDFHPVFKKYEESELAKSSGNNLEKKEYNSENESETKPYKEMNKVDSNKVHPNSVETEVDNNVGSGNFCDQVDGPSSEKFEEVASEIENTSEFIDGGDVSTVDCQKENFGNIENDGCNNSANDTVTDVQEEVPASTESSKSGKEQQAFSAENENTADTVDGESGKQTDDKDKEVVGDLKAGDNKETSSEYCLSDNLKFYRSEIHSRPFPGAKIEVMLTWKGDYQKLERTHSYIQWLFPIPESRGMNYSAQPLQEHEAQAISEDDILRNKVLEAFKMMLHFYGMELDQHTLTVKREDNWEERYEHLNRSIHNHYRITRIIKSLGELGWKHLQVSWLEFIIHEAVTCEKLSKLNDMSTMCHFIDALKDDEDKGKMYHYLADLNDPSHKNAEGNRSGFQDDAESNVTADESRQVNSSVTYKGDGLIEHTNENGVQNSKEEKPDEVNEDSYPESGKEGIKLSRENSAEIGEKQNAEKRNDDSKRDEEDSNKANLQSEDTDENELEDEKEKNKGHEVREHTNENGVQGSKEEKLDEVSEGSYPESGKEGIGSSRENTAESGEQQNVEKRNDDSKRDEEDSNKVNVQSGGTDENELDDEKEKNNGDELIEHTNENGVQGSKEEKLDEVNEGSYPESGKGGLESSRENTAEIGETQNVEKRNDDSKRDEEDNSKANVQAEGTDENEVEDEKETNADAKEGNSAKENIITDDSNKCQQSENQEESCNAEDRIKNEGLSPESENNSNDNEANEHSSELEKNESGDGIKSEEDVSPGNNTDERSSNPTECKQNLESTVQTLTKEEDHLNEPEENDSNNNTEQKVTKF